MLQPQSKIFHPSNVAVLIRYIVIPACDAVAAVRRQALAALLAVLPVREQRARWDERAAACACLYPGCHKGG